MNFSPSNLRKVWSREFKRLRSAEYRTVSSIAMENKPFHHLPDGTFRNPEGSPKIEDFGFNWSFKVFNEEKKNKSISKPYRNPRFKR